MAYTEEQKREFDLGCYGMLESELEADLKDQAELVGKEMLLMSMLSDVQHLIEHDSKELARMLVNRVKWAMQELPENERDAYIKKLREDRKQFNTEKESA